MGAQACRLNHRVSGLSLYLIEVLPRLESGRRPLVDLLREKYGYGTDPKNHRYGVSTSLSFMSGRAVARAPGRQQ